MDADWAEGALEPVFSGGMALLAEARARLGDDRLVVGLEDAGRAGLSVLLLDLATALMMLRAAAEGDMAAAAAGEDAERLDLPGQVVRFLTPALREARAPALQVVLLQVSGLAAQVLGLLEALTLESTLLPQELDPAGPWSLRADPLQANTPADEAAVPQRPHLRLVSPDDPV